MAGKFSQESALWTGFGESQTGACPIISLFMFFSPIFWMDLGLDLGFLFRYERMAVFLGVQFFEFLT